MPDLTNHSFYHCETAENWSTLVVGSKGKIYRVSWGPDLSGQHQYDFRCECKGFKYRGKCNHIEQVKNAKLHCGWLQFSDGGEPIDGKCPNCGSEVRSTLWAV